jgi:hypothetical protein
MNKVIKPEHVNIFYLGGSGGYFCLHLLLLTREYDCVFENDLTFDEVFNKQWNITSIEKWKNTEFTIRNDETLETTAMINKAFLWCNKYQLHLTSPGCKVLVYTDSKTQWMLSSAKKAGAFRKTPNKESVEVDDIPNRLLKFIIDEYKSIKADSWPNCTQFEDFVNLPNDIKHELVTKWNFTNRWDFDRFDFITMIEKYTNANNNTYNGDTVSLTDEMVETADIIIKLQDLVKTNGDVLFEKLGIQGNQKCIDFTNKWLNLHTDELKEMILK